MGSTPSGSSDASSEPTLPVASFNCSCSCCSLDRASVSLAAVSAIRVRSAVNAGVPLPPQAMRLLDNFSPDALGAPLSKLGVTFEAKKAPLEVVVIDSLLKAPTEN